MNKLYNFLVAILLVVIMSLGINSYKQETRNAIKINYNIQKNIVEKSVLLDENNEVQYLIYADEKSGTSIVNLTISVLSIVGPLISIISELIKCRDNNRLLEYKKDIENNYKKQNIYIGGDVIFIEVIKNNSFIKGKER